MMHCRQAGQQLKPDHSPEVTQLINKSVLRAWNFSYRCAKQADHVAGRK
jgi:hypothetical protein